MKPTRKTYESLTHFGVWILIGVLMNSCTAVLPVFSSMENAETLGKGHFEGNLGYSSHSAVNEGTATQLNDNLALRLGTGVSDKIDLKFRYERLSPNGFALFESGGFNYLGLEQKFELLEKNVALRLHEAFYFGIGASEPQLGFNFITSYFIGPQLDISLSPGYAVLPDGGAQHMGYANLGLGIGAAGPVQFRMEYGLLANLDALDSGTGRQFSFGLIFHPAKSKSRLGTAVNR